MERITEVQREEDWRGENSRGEERSGDKPIVEERSGSEEVIKDKVDTMFLGEDGTPHVGVRADFKENANPSSLTRNYGNVSL